MNGNGVSMLIYKPSQRLHPLSLLAQLTGRRVSGCLQVATGANSWSIYLENGQLTFASNSMSPFDRLDRHLRHLSRQVPALVSAVRVQVRLLFENVPENRYSVSADYRAINWLVEQQYLNQAEATALIEEMVKEVIESFLLLTEGSYEVVDKDKLEDYPGLCQFEVRPLVEYCQNQIRRRQPSTSTKTPPKPSATDTATPYKTQAAETPVAKPSSNLSSFAGKQISKSCYTIACIDDSPTVLQAIKSFLDDSTFAVVMINDPIKALIQVVRCKPDLVLLDVGMPNLDGYELCSLMRRHSSFKHTPIIMVTGHTGFIDRAKARLVGASGYLTKPFTQPELLKMVFKHLT